MDHQAVRKLEDDIEKALAEIFRRRGLKRGPVLPSQRTMHAMAKAAVAVYEAVADEQPQHERGDHDERHPEP